MRSRGKANRGNGGETGPFGFAQGGLQASAGLAVQATALREQRRSGSGLEAPFEVRLEVGLGPEQDGLGEGDGDQHGRQGDQVQQ